MNTNYFDDTLCKKLESCDIFIFFSNLLIFLCSLSIFLFPGLYKYFLFSIKRCTFIIPGICLLWLLAMLYINLYKSYKLSKNNNTGSTKKEGLNLIINSYRSMSVGIACLIASLFMNDIPIYIIIFWTLGIVMITISLSLLYYVKIPMYISSTNTLSLDNIFHSKRSDNSTNIGNFLIDVPYIIILSFVSLLAFAFYVLMQLGHTFIRFKHGKHYIDVIKWKGYHFTYDGTKYNAYLLKKIIRKYCYNHYKFHVGKLSKIKSSTFSNYDNIKCLKILEPKLNNICGKALICVTILLLLFMVFVIVLSIIYSARNDIYRYRIIKFNTKLSFNVLKFPVLTAPSIILLDKVIKYFECNPSILSMDSVLLIIFLFPFAEVFYVLYVINSFDKI